MSFSHALRLVRVQEASPSELLGVSVLPHNDRADWLVASQRAPGQAVMTTGDRRRAAAVGVGCLEALRVVIILYYALPAIGTCGRTSEACTTAAFVSSGSSGLSWLSR